jgi:protocatechuate 3,4-dioxygenase beta subunit
MALSGMLPSRARAQAAPTPDIELGPFYPIVKPVDQDADLTLIRGHRRHAFGDVIEVSGRVLDGRGNAIPGARIELWQANAAGRYSHRSDTNRLPFDPDFQGYARLVTDRRGQYRIITVRPGPYPTGPNSRRTPHIHMLVDGRVDRLPTQMFFPSEALNASDEIFRNLSASSQARAMARENGRTADGRARFIHDLVLATG